jgi:predicted nucleic acid-binding protein
VVRRKYVLDTSALFTLIEEEDGADRVEEVIRTGTAFLPYMALLEVHYVTRQEHGVGEADRRYAFLKQSPVEILWQVDESTLLTASRFKASHRISLADAIIAAAAFREEAVLLHKDPEFEALDGQLDLEALPYKKKDS